MTELTSQFLNALILVHLTIYHDSLQSIDDHTARVLKLKVMGCINYLVGPLEYHITLYIVGSKTLVS